MGSNAVLSRIGEFLAEAPILASINPKYDDKLFIELQFCTSSLHVMYSRKYFAWIPTHHLHLQGKFKLWAGKFA